MPERTGYPISYAGINLANLGNSSPSEVITIITIISWVTHLVILLQFFAEEVLSKTLPRSRRVHALTSSSLISGCSSQS